MPLDDYSQALLQARRAANIPGVREQPIAEVRAAREQFRQKNTGQKTIVLPEVDDYEVPVSGGQISARVYRPNLNRDLPAAMYFHGGGWVLGDLDHSDEVCRWLARESGCVIVNVGYRLAPEHTFPTAAEDSYTATEWVLANAERLGIDPGRLAVIGASAGGNLAAVVALLARDRGGPPLRAQVLVYPVLDAACTGGSYDEFADGFLVSATDMLWYWDQYVPNSVDRDSAYACPLRASDLRGLPATLVITAEYDPVRDDGERYAKLLATAGVATEQTRYEGTLHLFFGMPHATSKARGAVEQTGQFLRSHFESGDAPRRRSASSATPCKPDCSTSPHPAPRNCTGPP